MNVQDAIAWIADVFEEPSGRIKPETKRDQIPGWDSLGTLSLIAGLDERFDIHLAEKDIEGLRRVEDILDILRRHSKLEDA